MKILIIIPAYNEEKTIVSLVRSIQQHGWECLVINDCSTDSTPQVLEKEKIPFLNTGKNSGSAKAKQKGFAYARDHGYDAVISMDADGQHLPEYIPALAKGLEDYDYLIGSRFVNEERPWTARMAGSRLISAAIKEKTGFTVKDPTSGMCALRRSLFCELAEEKEIVAEADMLVYALLHGYRCREIPVRMAERKEGQSYFFKPSRAARFMYRVLKRIRTM
ncbi:MAG: glycosyltransferase family 2 protein [Erysipelotrichaceae bacterium]|nr:glycosyltransferase family 2 protein [Erysipelotrichaceae bacterium]